MRARSLLSVLVVGLLLVLSSCAPSPTSSAAGPPPVSGGTSATPMVTSSIIVVRHAEILEATTTPSTGSGNGAEDTAGRPSTSSGNGEAKLSTVGQQRARRLATLLGKERGVAVYASALPRSQQTAELVSKKWKVAMTTYVPASGATTLARTVREAHPTGSVLIVADQETVPPIVAAFCDCQVDPVLDPDFGSLFRVDFDADGAVIRAEQSANY